MIRKGYIWKTKRRKEPESDIVDYWFCEFAKDAMYWPVRELAENDCSVMNRGSEIPTDTGVTHMIRNLVVEEVSPERFVLCCEAPFRYDEPGSQRR